MFFYIGTLVWPLGAEIAVPCPLVIFWPVDYVEKCTAASVLDKLFMSNGNSDSDSLHIHVSIF